jgi:hypothetical protein
MNGIRSCGAVWRLSFLAVALAACSYGDNWQAPVDAADDPDAAPAAGITVNPTRGLRTDEQGGQDRFTVVLDSAPTAAVTIALTSSDPSEGVPSPTSLVFTPDDWATAQTVTVTGVDDDVADGDQPYTIITAPAVSSDGRYDGLDADDVEVLNLDDETPGAFVEPTAGLVTTEAGGTATFTLRLRSAPTAEVTIALTSSDPSEGTVGPASLTFTAQDWATAQTVTITGVDDDVADGDQDYQITAVASSADPTYDGIAIDSVAVVNEDDDTAGILIEAEAPLTTDEAGRTDALTIRLTSQPVAAVTITVASSDPTEGVATPPSVTFTPDDWDAARTITVTGVDDDVVDGDVDYVIAIGPAASTDPQYDGMTAPAVAAVNLDDDVAGAIVEPATSPASRLHTTEAGGTAQFTITLTSQPTADVTFVLVSSDPSEGALDVPVVTFTPANWTSIRTVTVTGLDDLVADGNVDYEIAIGPAVSADPTYHDLAVPPVLLTNIDDDSAGFRLIIPEGGLETTEFGDTDQFQVVLNSQPTADVILPVVSSNPDEGTVSPASLTFTAANWNLPQTVTVTGVDDAVADGHKIYEVQVGPSVSADPPYDGLPMQSVEVINIDNESPGIWIQGRGRRRVTYEDQTQPPDSFRIRLNVAPSADVTCSFASSDPSEGIVEPTSVTFTTANWSIRQTVTLRGVDDDVVDGDQPYLILGLPCVSPDSAYHGLQPPTVRAVNRDDD